MRFSSYAPCTIQRYPILFSPFFSLSFFRKVDLIHLPYPYFRLFKLSFCALISVSAFLRYFYFVSHFLCLTLSFYLKNCITRCSLLHLCFKSILCRILCVNHLKTGNCIDSENEAVDIRDVSRNVVFFLLFHIFFYSFFSNTKTSILLFDQVFLVNL